VGLGDVGVVHSSAIKIERHCFGYLVKTNCTENYYSLDSNLNLTVTPQSHFARSKTVEKLSLHSKKRPLTAANGDTNTGEYWLHKSYKD
jgi:hypothetical protein